MSLTRSNRFRSSWPSSPRARGSNSSFGRAFASCSRRWRCSLVSFLGVLTWTVAKRSPRPLAVDVRHPFASQAQRGARWRALVDLHGVRSVERRHLNLAAKGQRREVDRDLAEKVQAFPPEELVLLHVNDDVEMAGGAAGRSRLALALQPELLAGRDARGNLDRQLALAGHRSGAVACVAGLGDHSSRAAALRARLRERP